MSAAEVKAIEARIKAAALRVQSDDSETPAYPYVVCYVDGGIRSSDREADVRVTRTIGWQTTTVGTTREQCRAALDRLTAALEDWTPSVPGRSCSKVTHEGAQPVRKDDELPDRVLFFATDQWRVVSEPSGA